MSDKPLTRQALRFCAEYAKNSDWLIAGKAAGYAESTARFRISQWLRDPRYVHEIERLRAMANDELDACIGKMIADQRERDESVGVPAPFVHHDESLRTEMRAHGVAMAMAAQATGLSKQWVLEQLTTVYRMAIEGEKPQLAAANQSLNLIGTELGMFVRQQKITTETLDSLPKETSADELAKALGELPPDVAQQLLAMGQVSGKAAH